MTAETRLDGSWNHLVGEFDPQMRAPLVPPVPDGVPRPRWSVMIPTFNCAAFLRRTLESVLREAPGPDAMQIEVVDDVSTKDDPEAVVREVGGGRVSFFRKPRNEGSTPNFNTCVERSRGELVHVLHGDDCVLAGFYRRVEQLAAKHPDAAAFFTRSRIVDERGVPDALSPRLGSLAAPTRLPNELFYDGSPIRTPGAVIRRSFYETHGGFLPALLHTADWEMWVRATSLGGGLWVNEVLADYRMFAGNETGRFARTGLDLCDRLRLGLVFAVRFPAFDLDRYVRALSRVARRRMQAYQASGDVTAAEASTRLYHALTPRHRRVLHQWWDREVGHVVVEAPDAGERRRLIIETRAAAARGRSIHIWGAGKAGLACLARLDGAAVRVHSFVDSDVRKHGTTLEGRPIIGAAQLTTLTPKPFVIVASMYAPEITKTLASMGFDSRTDFLVA